VVIFKYKYYFITYNMNTVKTIKDIDDDVWHEFKSMAARNKMRTGKFFEKMVISYKEKSKSSWDDVLLCDKIISDKEADELERFTTSLRKEKGYRQ